MTNTQRTILRLIALAGDSAPKQSEIAAELGISRKRVCEATGELRSMGMIHYSDGFKLTPKGLGHNQIASTSDL